MMKTLLACGAALLALTAQAAVRAEDGFGWRAPIEPPAGASVVRVELPHAALMHMQSSAGNDVRVFNSAGEAVPFAWITPPEPAAKPPEEKAAGVRALPLFTLPASARKPQGAVQVHVGGAQPVWVRVDGAPAGTEVKPLDSVLFDTRTERKPWSAVDVQAQLPANTPVRVTAWTSADLAQWTPVAARGRLYRFEGDGAPANFRLVFDPPLALDDRYLRLDWSGQDGVSVAAISGVLAAATPQERRVRAQLPALQEVAPDKAELWTGFATRIAALGLATPRENTLVPVRVMGRSDTSQPWRLLGQTVVYRLGSGTDTTVNPPLELQGASVRQLRIESTNGAPLGPAQLRAEAQFAPRQLVFVASGSPPFTLAAGRDAIENAALPAPTVLGALGPRKPQDLPLATLGAAQENSIAPAGTDFLSRLATRQSALWLVLLAGVAILGGVAWTLMRQMKGSGGAN
jgi:hypothetical protein